MSNFQTILVAIFLSFAVFAVLIFSGAIKIGSRSGTDTLAGKVVIWGTFPPSAFSSALESVNSNNDGLSVSYAKKDSSTYQQDLIEAFANGQAPDLFVITPDMISRNDNFIYKIPYSSYPQKIFTESYIEGADIYMDGQNVLGFPIIVDPMVLYYNKDLITNEGVVYPPKSWDELFTLNGSLTKRDNAGKISQSMIALGQYDNVTNAKDILATLLIQNNNLIVKRDVDLGYVSTLNDNSKNTAVSPIESVLKFFVEFSNPSNTAYSWNRSLPSSIDMFTGGKTAFYLGRASELFNIQSTNPNLSFDVTQIPQIKNGATKRTYGEIYAIAINKKSSNLTSAFGVASALSKGKDAENLSIASSLPPASRALLAVRPESPYLFTFFNSALISRSWLDPDKNKSDLIFKELVENILSNNLSMRDAIGKAQSQFELLLRK